MNIQEYISSGILELYICGALSEKDSREVSTELRKHPEIKEEVEEIEAALSQLSSAVAPSDPKNLLASIQRKIEEKNVRQISTPKKSRNSWVTYIGWAASILLLIGLFSLIQDNNELRKRLDKNNTLNVNLEEQVKETEMMLSAIRDKDTKKVKLKGQEIAKDAYATAYFNPESDQVVIDASGLPEPPEGKVYQVWSLKLNPLKPTSLGLLKNFDENGNSLFRLKNTYASEGFGITLEPAGGSDKPTMSQLYTLGSLKS